MTRRPGGSCCKTWALAGCVLALCALLRACVAAAQPGPAATGRLPPRKPPVPSSALTELDGSSVLAVTLLDGSIVGVDANTGVRLWTFDSGAPLVSVHTDEAAGERVNIFPGVDGSLYAYHGLAPTGQAQLERLPMSLPDLVSASPSMAVDGSVVLGTRVSTVYALHRSTGQLVRLLSGVTGALVDPSSDGVHLPPHFDPATMVLLGREDFIVRSLRASTGLETWNATFARIMQLQHPMVPEAPQQPGGAPRLGAATASRLAVGPDNTLQAFDPRSGFRRWALRFDVPPIAAFDTGLGSTGVNQLDPSAQPFLLDDPQSSLPATPASPTLDSKHIMVGVLHGSLYAVPTNRLACVQSQGALVPTQPGHQLPGRVGGQDVLPALPFVPKSGAGKTITPVLPGAINSDSDEEDEEDGGLALIVPDSDALSLMQTVADDGDTGVASLMCPLGVHVLTGPIVTGQPNCTAPPARVPWLPAPATIPTEPPTRHTTPRAPRWHLGLLVGTAAIAGLMLTLALLWVRSYSMAAASKAPPPWAVPAPGPMAGVAQQPGSPVARARVGADGYTAPAGSALAADGDEGATGGERRKAGKARRRNRSGAGNGVAVRAEAAPLRGHAGSNGVDEPGSGLDKVDSARSYDVSAGSGSQTGDRRASDTGRVPSNGPVMTASNSNHGQGSHNSQRSTGSLTNGLGARAGQRQPDGSLVLGQLRVGPAILGYGSAGTVVYEGWLNNRPVAVKRLLHQFYDLAKKEIEVLIKSDEHANVVRCYAMEEDGEFVYLALERCRSTIADAFCNPQTRASFMDAAGTSPSLRGMAVMANIVAGLAALHERGIVHRDLKPHNVLLTDKGQAKLSDMGLSKQLIPEQSSFESHGAGGSSGWQAPEQLIARGGGAVRQTRAMDVFSLGCVLYYCATGGKHPFGEQPFERDGNIMRGQPNMAPLTHMPEAANLIGSMLAKDPNARPAMRAVVGHPLWWSSGRRLQFLVDVSDRVEYEDREPDQTLLSALEAHACIALTGSTGGPARLLESLTPPNWGTAVEPQLVANLGQYRRYNFYSLRDLLRVVRNKRNHFREMPSHLQTLLGSVPDGFLKYFTSRFPQLVMACWVFALRYLPDDTQLEAQYWPGGQVLYDRFVTTFHTLHTQLQQHRAAAGRAIAGIPPPEVPSLAALITGNSPAGAAPPAAQPPPLQTPRTPAAGDVMPAQPEQQQGDSSLTTPQQPREPGTPSQAADEGQEAQGKGEPNAGPSDLLQPLQGPGDDAPAGLTLPAGEPPPCEGPHVLTDGAILQGEMVVVGYEVDTETEGSVPGGEGTLRREFPQRPGAQVCDFYSKTGHCKFGEKCKFDHPASMGVWLTAFGLPLRPGEPICAHYSKHGKCAFGPACKFHHPLLRAIYAGTSLPPQAPPATAPLSNGSSVSAHTLVTS